MVWLHLCGSFLFTEDKHDNQKNISVTNDLD